MRKRNRIEEMADAAHDVAIDRIPIPFIKAFGAIGDVAWKVLLMVWIAQFLFDLGNLFTN